jgi:hypothetical protein
MKRYLFVMLVAGALANSAAAQAPVYFADPVLKAYVEASLGKTNPTPTDMLRVTGLNPEEMGIFSLVGLMPSGKKCKEISHITVIEGGWNMSGPLKGVVVLDMTWALAGPYCTKLLADYGADVIKIEPPGGDPTRAIGPFYHNEVNPEKSLYWFAFNANKRSITLDIETTDGREIFKKLVKSADVVVESFAPGYLEKIGLGYPVLSVVNPRIILTSMLFNKPD